MPQATFTTTGWHTWNVPTGVKTIKISLDGAGSGSNGGGRVQGNLAVDDRWTLYVLIGAQGGLNSGASGGNNTTGGGAAGGDGQLQGTGGDSGGGASAIRINSKTGSLKAVAGGAGGDSGDGGRGGPGGGTTGGSGEPGTTGSNYTSPATGGTQSQGGNGGTSSAGASFNGKNAVDTVLATGGAGGQTAATVPSHGGGGGGGGYRAGGGGQAASFGSKVLESTNQMLSPWDTAAAGSTPAKFTTYVSGTRIQATNLAQNPGLEGAKLDGWYSNNGTVYPVTLDATSAMSGIYSALSTRTATSPNSTVASYYLVAGTVVSVGFACTPGQPIVCSLDWKSDQASRKMWGYFQWLDGAGTLLSSQSAQFANQPTTAANTTYRFTFTGVPPVGAVTARPIVSVNTGDGSNALTGERVWLDRLRVSTGSATADALNLFPNPGTGDNTQNGSLASWSSNNSSQFVNTLETAAPLSGRYSCLQTRQAATLNRQVAGVSLLGTGTGSTMPCTAGLAYSMAVDVKVELGGRYVNAYFQWFNAAGSLISSDPATPNQNLTAGVPLRITCTGTAVTGAAGMRVVVQVFTQDSSNATVGERTWWDAAMVNAGSVALPYFNGSTPPDGTYVYVWTNVVSTSTSQRYKINDQQMADAVYFDGSTPATTQLTYNWSGTANASTSNRSYNGNNTFQVVADNIVQTNYASNPNLEGGSTNGWLAQDASSYSLAASTTLPISGTRSCMTTTLAGNSSPTHLSTVVIGGQVSGSGQFTLPSPGQSITCSVDVRVEAANRRIFPFLYWYDGSGAYIGNDSLPYVDMAANTVTRIVATKTPPANAVTCYFLIDAWSTSGNVPTGERLWLDRLMIGGSTYFDGATAASGVTSYRWTGTANASTSQKYTPATEGLPTTDKRPVIQTTNTGGNNKTGVRTSSSANVPAALTAGSVVTFSAWVRVSPDYPIGSIYCIMRDDPNNDSLAVTFDGRGATRAINAGVWTRLDWTATVKASRTVTGIYLDTQILAGTLVLPVGAYFQTTAWMVNKSPALLDYYDGDTADDSFYDYLWSGTRGASTSLKQHQTVPYAPGGGGGGGSSFTGGLTGAANLQGAAGAGNGALTITWVTPAPANQPPTPPTGVKINNVDATGGMLTKATKSVKVTATINDPNADNVRMLLRWSTSSNMSGQKQAYTGYVKRNTAVSYTINGLGQNKHYYLRLYTQDSHGLYSTSYTSIDFWTNKGPWAEPNSINTQGSGMTLPSISSATFAWTHHDDDVADYQTGFRIRYRVAATSTAAAGAWTEVLSYTGDNTSKVPGPPTSSVNHWTFNPSTFKGNRFYEWSVKTRDGQALWGTESTLFTFWVSSTTSPPILLTPKDGGWLDVNNDNTLTWRFLDPDPTKKQVNADLRYRAVGGTKAIADGESPIAGQWITLSGVSHTATSWVLPEGSFQTGFTYEWEVRTYNSVGGPASDWSDPFFFYAIGTPGADAPPFELTDGARPQGSLGCGTYRVFIYQQGGQKRVGEVDPVTSMTFTRLRDDISNCVVQTNGYSEDCGQLYAQVRSWMHEIVVVRDGVRVWEGPITRITYTQTSVEFEAKDVMAYIYRRVMRYGYNDAYRLVKKGTGGQPDTYLGLLSVVKRAQELIVQALAPYDPNVLPYLTTVEFDDDAKESRVVANWSRTVWEEVDDLAATAGLDYTTVGRRIILWDTHRSIGRLPELRDGDFSDSPIVTEYGMQLATFFAVTNNSGVAGTTEVAAKTKPYGPIELLASSYSESESAAPEVLTPEAVEKAQAALVEQAKRNISNRWPSPVVVRIPDNSTLSPDANIGFQQLIPGVWMPLRSINTPRQVLQWQKLDSVSVDVDNTGETVKVVLSPAPRGGEDPDSDQGSTPD